MVLVCRSRSTLGSYRYGWLTGWSKSTWEKHVVKIWDSWSGIRWMYLPHLASGSSSSLVEFWRAAEMVSVTSWSWRCRGVVMLSFMLVLVSKIILTKERRLNFGPVAGAVENPDRGPMLLTQDHMRSLIRNKTPQFLALQSYIMLSKSNLVRSFAARIFAMMLHAACAWLIVVTHN